MSDNVLSSISYLHQFIRYSEEQNLELNYSHITNTLEKHKGQDFIPFNDFKVFVHDIYSKSSCPWLGLHFAQKIQLSSHGSLGFAVSHGIDLGECLELISRYYQTRLQAIGINIQVNGEDCLLEIKETCTWEPIRELLYEVLLASLLNVIEFVIGKGVEQCTVCFPYKAPAWQDKYVELLPCSVHFDAKTAGVTIPKSLLKITSVTANPRSVELARAQCDEELSRLNQFDSLEQKVVSLVEQAHDYSLSIEEIARNLNMSKSTLARKLKTENTSFSKVMANLRKAQAKNLLLNTQSSIEAIALTLGYDDASNFNRSFKRWFDSSPSQFRQAHKQSL